MATAKQPRAIAWGGDINIPKRPHVLTIVSARPQDAYLIGVCLSERWEKVWTHCFPPDKPGGKRRPAPHFEPYESCDGCMLLRQRPRAKYYAPCWLNATSRIVIFELTEGVPDLVPEVVDESYNWRGVQIRPYRLGKDERSRMSLEIQRKVTAPGKLPPVPDIRQSLEVLWGLLPNTIPGYEQLEGGEA